MLSFFEVVILFVYHIEGVEQIIIIGNPLFGSGGGFREPPVSLRVIVFAASANYFVRRIFGKSF